MFHVIRKHHLLHLMRYAIGQRFMGGDDFFLRGQAMKNVEFGRCVSGFEHEDLHVARKVIIETGQVFPQPLMVDGFLAEVPVHRMNQKACVRGCDAPACRQKHDDAHRFDIARVDCAKRYWQRLQERVEREAKIGAAPASGQVQEKGGGTLVDSFKAAIPEALGRCLVDLAMKMHDVFSH